MKIRTFQFAVATGKLIMSLPPGRVNNVYLNQLAKSSSSVGANYRAARRGKSDADFLNKLKIAEEEADECIYFLELISEFNPEFKEHISFLIKEGAEILKIIVASITTTRQKIALKKDTNAEMGNNN
ncbi:four helix bundle protein [Foetidibacter luteolus]|uniref:four helix bundle protein n=1 Tax=Foetidibacter luteolus TaxID=2608880 RepID=UPI001A98855C|nr:four helix bundle protein [Foetidibacter luteolus]